MLDGDLAPTKQFLVADLFCGAGGSSTGARRALAALGYRMNLVAVNHWNVAIETHSKNHPEARHYLRDLMAADPIELVPEGKLDLLMASPTCTHHSRARGGKPSSDQQRMDPWAIVRWCSELRVKRLLVENVPEFVEWGPINLLTGRPIKRRKGEYFRAWAEALRGLGFGVEWRVLNAADYGDATTRVRFFLMARSDGKRITWPEPTHSRDGIDLFGAGHKWRAAREIIDWRLEGKSIYGRKKALAAATLRRIYAGAVKFNWPEPYLVVLRRHMDTQSLDAPLPSLCASGTHLGLAEPFLLNRHGTAAGDDNLQRHAGGGSHALIVRADQTGGNGLNVRSIEEPIGSLTGTHGGGLAIVEPVVVPMRAGMEARAAEEPLPGLTTKSQIAIAEAFVCGNRTNNTAKPIDGPIGGITTTTGGVQFLVEPGEPFVLNQDQSGALPTIAGAGAHALICPYYGSGSGETCGTVENPLPTCTAKARFGLVAPVTHGRGGGRSRSIEEPLPTITGAHRGELAVIVAAFGEREGQAPRVHSVEEPCPTICAKGRVQLAEADERSWDIRFRMLQPHELAAAMGFSGPDAEYEFVGNKTEITKQIGNAVPVNTASALVKALFHA